MSALRPAALLPTREGCARFSDTRTGIRLNPREGTGRRDPGGVMQPEPRWVRA